MSGSAPRPPPLGHEVNGAPSTGMGGSGEGSSKDRDGPPPAKKVKVGARASLACHICRKRKVRCSAEYPTCSFCAHRNLVCEYDGHPDMYAPRPSGNVGQSSPGDAGVSPSPSFAPDLPSRELIKEAVHAFFLHYAEEGVFTFVHRPTLIKSVETDAASPETLLCLLAVAARFCPTLKAQRGGAAAVSSFYGDQALALIRRTPDDISLSRLHSHLFLGLNDLTSSGDRTSRGWMHIGQSLRMAQLLRLGYLDEEDPGRWEVEKRPLPTSRASDSAATTPTGGVPAANTAASSSNANAMGPPPPPLPTAQILDLEIKRRTWWSCYLLERLFCDGRALPALLRASDVTTRFPCADSDFVVGRRGASARFGGPAPPWGPISIGGVTIDEAGESPSASSNSGDPSGASSRPRYASTYARTSSSHQQDSSEPDADLYGQMMRVADLWAQVKAYISKGGRRRDRRAPWVKGSSFWYLDKKLNEWDESLPAHLQYSEATLTAHSMIGQGKLYGLMHIMYFIALLYLHRDYIPFIPPRDYDPANGPTDGEPLYYPSDADRIPPPGWWSDSATTCFRAANAITDVFINLKSRGSELTNPFAGFAVLTAGTMHVHLYAWPSSAPDLDAPDEYLSSDTRILNDMRQYWGAADNWCQALNTAYALDCLIVDRNSASTTSISQPLHVVRSRLMAIIRAQDSEEPTPGVGEDQRPIDLTELDLFSKLSPPAGPPATLGNGGATDGIVENSAGGQPGGSGPTGPGPFQPLDLASTFPQLFNASGSWSNAGGVPVDPALQDSGGNASGPGTPNRAGLVPASNSTAPTTQAAGEELFWDHFSSFFASGWNNPLFAGGVGGTASGPAATGSTAAHSGSGYGAQGLDWISAPGGW